MSDLLEAIKSASPEQVVVAFGAAMEAAYVSHPRDGAQAAIASIAAQQQAQAKAEAEAAVEAAKAAETASAPVDPLVPDATEDADNVAENHDA